MLIITLSGKWTFFFQVNSYNLYTRRPSHKYFFNKLQDDEKNVQSENEELTREVVASVLRCVGQTVWIHVGSLICKTVDQMWLVNKCQWRAAIGIYLWMNKEKNTEERESEMDVVWCPRWPDKPASSLRCISTSAVFIINKYY
jgi:hypothetical protein